MMEEVMGCYHPHLLHFLHESHLPHESGESLLFLPISFIEFETTSMMTYSDFVPAPSKMTSHELVC